MSKIVLNFQTEPDNFDAYRNLCIAICTRACEDYVFYSKQIKRTEKLLEKRPITYKSDELTKLKSDYNHAVKEVDDSKHFLRYDWFEFLTHVCLGYSIDGERVIERLNKRIMEESYE